MIRLYLEKLSAFNGKTHCIDEETLLVVDHSCDNNEQKLVKSILNNLIIGDLSSIKYIHIDDRQTDVKLQNDVILTIASTSVPYKDDTLLYITIANLDRRGFDIFNEIFNVGLYITDFIKLLKAQHKDEVLAYLLLKGIIK